MIVKIQQTFYNSEIEPIMIELSDEEYVQLMNTGEKPIKLCSHPKQMTEVDIRDFMEEPFKVF